jgi:hypothetical protein
MKTFIRMIAISTILNMAPNGFVLAQDTVPAVRKLPLRVVVDPRVELISTIFRLAGNREYCQGKVDSYAKDVDKQFGQFRKHQAVLLARKLREEHSVSYDACMSMAVHITDTEKCEEKVPFEPLPENLDDRWSPDNAREFLAAVRQFVKDTNFNEFISAHRSLYETTQSRMEDCLEKNAHLEWFDEYFGSRPEASFTVAVGLLNGPGNYGVRCRTVDGKEELYCILGVWKTDEKGLPAFDRSMMGTVVHEFCHSYVNPLTEKYKTELDKYAKLFDPISNQMKTQAYPMWNTCVIEHIVRALTTRYSYLKVGKEAGDKSLQYEKQRGFFYVPALCESLQNYENNRDKYKTFADFYPKLIKVFEDLSKQNLGKDFYFIPYEGTINAVGQDKKSVIIIIPTNESDPDIQKNIHEFVRQIQRRFFPQSPVITDAEAIKRDLSGNSIFLYGTMNGNLWLKENASKFPFKLEENRIVADTVYEGTDLRLISAWPNPQNSKRGIAIYTAQQAKDIIKINSVFHGPTDYVIARNTNILKAANYNKKDGVWTISKNINPETTN